MELADGARTLAAVSAEAILKSAEHMPRRQSCGSSAAAAARTRTSSATCGRRQAAGAEVILAEDAGLNGDSIEAEAWAYLAVRR